MHSSIKEIYTNKIYGIGSRFWEIYLFKVCSISTFYSFKKRWLHCGYIRQTLFSKWYVVSGVSLSCWSSPVSNLCKILSTNSINNTLQSHRMWTTKLLRPLEGHMRVKGCCNILFSNVNTYCLNIKGYYCTCFHLKKRRKTNPTTSGALLQSVPTFSPHTSGRQERSCNSLLSEEAGTLKCRETCCFWKDIQ